MYQKRNELSPTQQSILDVLKQAKGRYVRSHVIRDKVMPGKHLTNVKVNIHMMRLKGLEIETGGMGQAAKGYRLAGAA